MILDKIFRRKEKPETPQNKESVTQRSLEEWRWEVIVFEKDGSQLKGYMNTLPSLIEPGIWQVKTSLEGNTVVTVNPDSVLYLITNREEIKNAPIKLKIILENNEELEIVTNYLPQSGQGIWGYLEGKGDVYVSPGAWKSFEQITKEGETKNPIN